MRGRAAGGLRPSPARRLQGSVNPSSGKPGGTFFFAYPYGSGVPVSTVGATLEYDVYFDPNFDFNKGAAAVVGVVAVELELELPGSGDPG